MAFGARTYLPTYGLSDDEEDEILRSATAGARADMGLPAREEPPFIALPDDEFVIPVQRREYPLPEGVMGLGLPDDDEPQISPVRAASSQALSPAVPPPPAASRGLSDPNRPASVPSLRLREPMTGHPLRNSEVRERGMVGQVSMHRPQSPWDTRIPDDRLPNAVGLPDDEPIASVAPVSEEDEPIGPAPEPDVRVPVAPREKALARPDVRLLTPEEKTALADASQSDIRHRRGSIAGRVIGGLAAGIGLLTGAEGLTALGGGVVEGSNRLPSNERESIQAEIDARVAREQGAAEAFDTRQQSQMAQANAAAEAERQAARDALSARGAEADIALVQQRLEMNAADQAAEAAESDFEREALRGNAAGMRDAIRARADAVVDDATRQSWQARFGEGSALDSMTDLDSLRSILAEVGDTDVRRGGQGRGGAGGAGRVGVNPLTGATVVSGGRRAPAAAGLAEAPADGSPRVPRAPAPPEAIAAPTPDPELAALAQAYPGLTGPEFDIARAEMMRRSLTPADLATPAGQGVIRTIVNAYRAAGHEGQRAMLQQAGSTYAATVGGEVAMPPEVDPALYARMVRPMTDVYQGWVQPFERARSALRAAREAGASEAAIRIAMQGGNNDALARVATAQMMPALQSLKTQAALMSELFGRERSGAAISDSEWSNFRNILGTQNIYLTGSAQFDGAMRDLGRYGRSLIQNRAAEGGEFAHKYVDYFLRSIAASRGQRAPARTAPTGGR